MEAQPRTIQCGGVRIQAIPFPLFDDKWDCRGEITDHAGIRVFSAANTFDTEEDAVRASLRLGCGIVDGTIEAKDYLSALSQ